MRSRSPWLLALPLMVAGSFGAHALSYGLVSSPGGATAFDGDAHGMAERMSTGAASYSVVPAGLVAALVVAAFVAWLAERSRGGRRRGASPWLFFTLPLLAFTFQELAERLLGAESAPFRAALEPRFLIGLALQVPFGLVAFLIAHLLIRAVKSVGRLLARTRPLPDLRRVRLPWQIHVSELPCIPVLALGYSQRGPPVL
jgi:hypothetical protein